MNSLVQCLLCVNFAKCKVTCFVFPHVESACVHFNLVFRVLASKFSGGWVGVVFTFGLAKWGAMDSSLDL